MRLRGEAIDRDTVLVWTSDREVTRFSRDGTRSTFTLPFAPLAARIHETVVAIDARGTVHRFSRDGTPLGIQALAEAPGEVIDAAIDADGAIIAIVAGIEVQVFANGQLRPWSFTHRRPEGWRETGVDISGDGTAVLVRYELRGGENLGDNVEAFSITRSDGQLLYRHFARHLPSLAIEMSPDARRIALCEHEQFVWVADTPSMAPLHRIEPVGRVSRMCFDGLRLGVLHDYELVIFDDAEQRIALPEQFDDFVFSGDEVVCVHPELGAWWIKAAAVG